MGLKEYLFGFSAEDRACEFLQNHGFAILCRNFRSRFGEIDIIAKKDEILHFIEVKATLGEYETAYRLTKSKFEKIPNKEITTSNKLNTIETEELDKK